MQVEKLEDICEIASGGTPKRSEDSYWKNGKIPWLKISDIKSKYVDKSEEHITQKGLDNSSAKLFKKGTIIYTIFATVGEVAILNIDATTNQAIAGLTIKDSAQINPSYLFYFLKSIKKQMHLLSRGVAQNNINLSVLRQIKVPIPDLNVQERIVNALDQMQNNIKLRQMELSKLDTLIKARFVEMFGDPGLVHHENKVCNLENVAEVRSSHRIFTREFTKSGVPFYRGTEISLLANGKEPIHSYYISKARYDEITKNDSKPKIGDLLMPSICDKGQIWLVNTSKPFYYKDGRVLCISPNREKFNTIFFHQYMKMKSQIEYLKIGSGSTFAEFKIFQLKKLKINIPPLKLQNEFASFVQQVDKSKVVNNLIMKYIISIDFICSLI